MAFVRLIFLAALLVACPTIARAQVVAVPPGSAADARSRQEIQRRAAAEQRDWETATKLHSSEDEKIPVVPRQTLGIHQIVDGKVTRNLDDGTVGYLEGWSLKVVQVVNSSELILHSVNPDLPDLWVKGCDTGGISDGESVRIVGLVKLAGTRTYDTVSGTQRSIRLAHILSAEEERQYAAEQKRSEDEKRFRTWTAANGDFSTEALFVDFSDGKVILRKRDQTIVKLSPAQLSRKDQQYYRDVLKERRKAKTKASP